MILVLAKALNILELLGKNPNREVTLSEIAETLNLDRGTCSNILKTLASRGYAQQSGPRQGYKLGYMFYKLTNSDVNNDELTKIAREDVRQLGLCLNESTLLSVIRNDKRVVLFHTDPDREIIVRANIDKSVYSACTGRVILANYSAGHMEKFIIRNGIPSLDEWPSIYDTGNPNGALMNELSSIRVNGYAQSLDKNDIVGIAAPIFRDEHVIGSVGTFMPQIRMGNPEKIINQILDCASRINRKIQLTDGV